LTSKEKNHLFLEVNVQILSFSNPPIPMAVLDNPLAVPALVVLVLAIVAIGMEDA
jgi:hypothetical protein